MKPQAMFHWLLAPLLVAAIGCSGSDPNLCTVRGTLNYKGKPIPGVYLRFEPDDLTTKSTSMAVTDASGKFEMFIGSTPGVFRGKVKVYCDDPLAAMGSKTPVPPDIEPAYRELCDKYGSGKSTYELTIDSSNSNLELNLD
ncbi:MAG: hypothetical protein L0211_06225 [Planctomycetaceae bacterium]|nr:hypothetical protein [Planctomycetaceae bacterium]